MNNLPKLPVLFLLSHRFDGFRKRAFTEKCPAVWLADRQFLLAYHQHVACQSVYRGRLTINFGIRGGPPLILIIPLCLI